MYYDVYNNKHLMRMFKCPGTGNGCEIVKNAILLRQAVVFEFGMRGCCLWIDNGCGSTYK